jgi:hypothetical protein
MSDQNHNEQAMTRTAKCVYYDYDVGFQLLGIHGAHMEYYD